MQDFFKTLKELHSIEKSIRAVEENLKNEFEKIKDRQEIEMVENEEAERMFKDKLSVIEKYNKIKKLCQEE